MQRSIFLKLTGIENVGQWDARAARGQLPFYSVSGPAGRDYTPFDAFLIEMADKLASWGCGLVTAADTVRNHSLDLKAGWKHITSRRPKDFFFGVAMVQAPTSRSAIREGVGMFDTRPLIGTLDNFAKSLRDESRVIESVNLANASEAWDQVTRRARANDIDISNVFGGS